jgi:Spy/CpxP family protein refolding chaperone
MIARFALLSLIALPVLALGAAGIAAAGGHGFLGHVGHGHGFHRGLHAWDEEDVRDAVGWWLRGVDASDEQVAAVAQIVAGAAADLRAMHEEHRAGHGAFLETLAAPELDAARLEGLRADGVALVERGSKRAVAALAEIAAQLTPEQRAELLERHERRHSRWLR